MAADTKHADAARVYARHPKIQSAVESYVRTHTHFRSSKAFEVVKADLTTATTFNALFGKPIQHKVFDMAGAIAYCFFLDRLCKKVVAATPASAASTATPAPPAPPGFDIAGAFAVIGAVYDEGVRDDFDVHFCDTEGAADSDSDYAEEDEEEAAVDGRAAAGAKK